MYKGPKVYLILLLLSVWIVDFIDMRYFYYFFKREAHQVLGMKMHFTVALRYPIAAIKWILTVALFPDFFAQYKRTILIIFVGILFADILSVSLIKFDIISSHFSHKIFYSLLRLKIMNNYFLVFIAGLAILDQLKKYHERFPTSNYRKKGTRTHC